MATVKDYAKLSNTVYEGGNCEGWSKLDVSISGSAAGFQAAVYKNSKTEEIVVVIAGTSALSDARDCADIVDGRKPPQFDDALRLYEKTLKEYPSANISVTGHSLGGACAAYVASQYSVSATTFNAPGIGAIVSSARGSIQEYLVMSDEINIFGKHIGTENWYCPTGKIDESSRGLKAHSIEEQWLTRRKYDAMGNPTNECKGEEEPEDEPPDQKFEDFRRVDPLILDLNKDGTLTSAISKNTNFDHDGNGFAERTAWISQGDGLLVMDRDGNGSIDTGKELFGDQTILANGNKATNGFAALAELDKNRDGKIDVNDAAWSELRVWLDNGNGITEDGELKTLEELGIKSLNLSKTSSNTMDEQGNTKLNNGTFTWLDGTSSEMSDFLLQTDRIHSVPKDTIEVSDEIKDRPYLPGYGTIEDSWQFMSKETDGKLSGLIDSFANETDAKARDILLDQIIYTMAGVSDVDPSSRGGYINAQKLMAMERIYAQKFSEGRNPNSYAASLLDSMYDNLKKYYSGWLVSQTHEKDLFDKIDVTFNTYRNTVNVNFSRVKEELESRISADFGVGRQSLSDLVNGMLSRGYKDNSKFKEFCQYFISQNDALALAIYAADRNIIVGGSGRDILNARSNKEMLVGGAGNDVLEAHGGDTVLYGGAGNDELRGCKGASAYYWGVGASDGNVTYIWNQGDGNDTIVNAVAVNNSSNNGISQIRFGVGITLDNLQFKQAGDSAQIINKATGEVLTIRNWFYHDDYKIDKIIFANGEELLQADIKQLIEFAITDGNDRLIGGNYTENILDGGAGDDYLEGGMLNDIYVWGRDYGHDVINNLTLQNVTSGANIDGGFDKVQFKAGLVADDLAWTYYGNDLVATIKDTGETLTFRDWYANELNVVDVVEFADGSLLTSSELDALATMKQGTGNDDVLRGADTKDDTLQGNGGNDVIYGNNGNDFLYGGLGNDSLYGGGGNDIFDGGAGDDYMEGGTGNDTYIWGRGYGNDTINNIKPFMNSGDIDTLTLSEGVRASDLVWKKDGNNLIVTIIDSDEKLTISNWYAAEENMLTRVVFADGTVMISDEINDLTKVIQGTEANELIKGGDTQDDIIKGEGGNDTIDGKAGNDGLYGGLGNDKLYGGMGNDILDGGTGDDYLEGGKGNDTYIWGRGYGNDTINNVVKDYYVVDGGVDILQIQEGVSVEDIDWKINGNDLIAIIKDTGEKLTLSQWYASKLNMLDSINFADGTILTAAEINAFTKITHGTAGNDKIYGSNQNDYIKGYSGDDELYGYSGNDILDGGTGKDILTGGKGNDTYIWGRGLGNDTIDNTIWEYSGLTTIVFREGGADILQLNAGLSMDDLVFDTSGNDLLITIKDTNEKLIIRKWYTDKVNVLDGIKFADGTFLTTGEINTIIADSMVGTENNDYIYGVDTQDNIIKGLGGNDSLVGGNCNDILDGGAGDDYLEGRKGNDTYIWGRGYGNDTIYNVVHKDVNYGEPIEGGMDILQLTEGLVIGDITWRADGQDLVITITDTKETLRLEKWYNNKLNWLDEIRFADGTVLKPEDISVLTNFMQGTDGNDYMKGSDTTDDIMSGGVGDDRLYGYDGNDVLDGGSGNDYLEGGKGNDTYIWGRGYGNDRVYNLVSAGYNYIEGGMDVLRFTEGLVASDIIWRSDGDDLIATIKDTGETLTLIDWYYNKLNVLDSIIFADGTILTPDELHEMTKYMNGTDGDDIITGGDTKDNIIIGGAGNDELRGGEGNDVLYGGEGNDKLFAGSGDNILDGGAGDDYLEGWENNTYIWGRGYGNDTINNLSSSRNVSKLLLQEGLVANDLEFTTDRKQLIITIKDTGETIIFKNCYTDNGSTLVDSIQFADGTQMLRSEINDIIRHITGTDGDDILTGVNTLNNVIKGAAGNDTIYGSQADDILDGGIGDDYLEGGAGRDTYIWGRGHGNDTINNKLASYWEQDKLQLTQGISADDLIWRAVGKNLVATIKDTGETLTILDWYDNELNMLDKINFADGSILYPSDINGTAQYIIGTEGDDVLEGVNTLADIIQGGAGNDKLYGYGGNDQLYGGAGNDKLYGGDGDDILDGGAGNDTLEGGAGDDTYIWGRGYSNTTINNAGGNTNGGFDKVRFVGGLTSHDLTWRAFGNNLIAKINSTGRELTFVNWYSNKFNEVDQVVFDDGSKVDIAAINEAARLVTGTDAAETLFGGDSKNDVIRGEGGNDKINAKNGDDLLYGGTGDDQLYGENDDDTLYGEEGNDSLYGGSGNDILDGGIGDDYLEGGLGDDTYIWGRGYGNDTINNVVLRSTTIVEGGVDKLQLTKGLVANDIAWSKEGNNLVATIKDSGETLVLTDWYANPLNMLDSVRFADGTTLVPVEIEELTKLAQGDVVIKGGIDNDVIDGGIGNDQLYGGAGHDELRGGAGNDTMYGETGNDTLYGGSGDDQLYGDAGNDVLDAGIGADYLEGGLGNDTYIWGRGYGNDTINNTVLEFGDYVDGGVDIVLFKEGLSLEDLIWQQDGNNVVAKIKDSGETLNFINWYVHNFNPIDSVRFVDGTSLTTAQINELTRFVFGTNADDVLLGREARDDIMLGEVGNDSLYGYTGNDTLNGGLGNDYLEGGLGNDTYIWGRGLGNDTINNTVLKSGSFVNAGQDRVLLQAGLLEDDLSWRSYGNDLIATIKDSGETLTFKDWYANSINMVDVIEFADGATITPDAINELTKIIIGSSNDDILKGSDTRDDIIDGGAGNDYLEGGLGNDTYVWGRGYGNDIINNVVKNSMGVLIEGGVDKLRLVEGVVAADLSWDLLGNNLIVTIKDTGETLTVADWSVNELNMLDSVHFADGTVLTSADINGMSSYIIGSEGADTIQGSESKDIIKGEGGNDTIYGYGGNDELYGGAGNDKLYGGEGNDILDGELGMDTLEGGAGDDVYIWGRDCMNGTINNIVKDAANKNTDGGYDTVRFKEGLTAEDITWRAFGNNLIGRVNDTGRELTFTNWYANKFNEVDRIEFADGTTLDIAALNEQLSIINGTDAGESIAGGDTKADTIYAGGGNDKINAKNGNDILYGGDGDDQLYGENDHDTLYGEAGNDSLYGGAGNDTIDGGLGDDYLEGGAGNDTYIWGRGSGNDTINNVVLRSNIPVEGGADKLQLAAGVSNSDITWSKSGNNLVATIDDTGETLTFTDWYANTLNMLDSVHFADGTTLTAADINALTTQPVATALMRSAADALPMTGYQIDITDTALQQIAYATIAFDGERSNLGCGISPSSYGNTGLENQITFAADSLNSKEKGSGVA